jgi:APA family basic amino acid/polyamine antiporter
MAREKVFFRKLGNVHPRFRTPGNSLVVQGIWTSILVLTGTFDQLTNMMVFVSWIFYALASVSVFTLRKKMPDAPRPYRVWGYPITPIVFILFASVYIVFTLYSDFVSFKNGATPIINSVMGLFWVAIGIPGYFYWSRKERRERG